ncbi:hypothetical protein P9G84_31770 [Brevibacillus centrosporus]|uniref:hypothetical protein n=1 Tax=Brevibacillus centrosporus TaxID=54910 RepID=UPI001143F1E5|nr:hypothetical protein [Brevibacillus centrosporus]MEC2133434.1 hypothetical protein [Brevibacillus centrosporus]GED34097.1 hypothetical protein BCE02nite_52380 [Brevibacillus centrosporus]
MIGRFYNDNGSSSPSSGMMTVFLFFIIPGFIFGFTLFPDAGILAPILGMIPFVSAFLIMIWYNGYKIRERNGYFYSDEGVILIKTDHLEYSGKTIEFDSIKYASSSTITMYRIEYHTENEKYGTGNVFITFDTDTEMNMFKQDFLKKYRASIRPRKNPFVY